MDDVMMLHTISVRQPTSGKLIVTPLVVSAGNIWQVVTIMFVCGVWRLSKIKL
jgi:hypothetical protein